MRHVALLRGINVGGKNKLPMKELAAMFAEAGCAEVATYIQSGNVVFSAGAALAKRIPGLISAEIAARFGHRVPLVMRSATELAKVVRENPFIVGGVGGVDATLLHVAFLDVVPSSSQISSLEAPRFVPDEFVVRGREVFLRLPNGVGKSKLTNAYLDGRLKAVSTLRNWRTVLELVRMCEA